MTLSPALLRALGGWTGSHHWERNSAPHQGSVRNESAIAPRIKPLAAIPSTARDPSRYPGPKGSTASCATGRTASKRPLPRRQLILGANQNQTCGPTPQTRGSSTSCNVASRTPESVIHDGHTHSTENRTRRDIACRAQRENKTHAKGGVFAQGPGGEISDQHNPVYPSTFR